MKKGELKELIKETLNESFSDDSAEIFSDSEKYNQWLVDSSTQIMTALDDVKSNIKLLSFHSSNPADDKVKTQLLDSLAINYMNVEESLYDISKLLTRLKHLWNITDGRK